MLEGVEPLVPERAELGQNLRRVSKRRGTEPASVNAPAPLAAQEPRAFEHLNVLGNRLERHVEGLGQLRDRALLACDSSQDFTPRRVRQGAKNAIEMRGPWLNHSVE